MCKMCRCNRLFNAASITMKELCTLCTMIVTVFTYTHGMCCQERFLCEKAFDCDFPHLHSGMLPRS